MKAAAYTNSDKRFLEAVGIVNDDLIAENKRLSDLIVAYQAEAEYFKVRAMGSEERALTAAGRVEIAERSARVAIRRASRAERCRNATALVVFALVVMFHLVKALLGGLDVR